MYHQKRVFLTSETDDVDAILRDMIMNRPIQSIPIQNYKVQPGGEGRVSVVSFFQLQSSHPRSVSVNSLRADEISHPSVASLMTDLANVNEAMHGFELLAEGSRFYVKPTTDNSKSFGQHANTFEILDNKGFRIYTGYEAKDFNMNKQSCWCGVRNVKPFQVLLLNFVGREIFRIEGEPGICGGGKMAHFFCGKRCIGRVEQDNDYGSTLYKLIDDKGQVLSILKGPETGCCGCKVVHSGRTAKLTFDLLTKDLQFHLGKIAKTIHHLTPMEIDKFAAGDDQAYFGVLFYSKDIDVKVKALALGTLFLLHFEFINDEGENLHPQK